VVANRIAIVKLLLIVVVGLVITIVYFSLAYFFAVNARAADKFAKNQRVAEKGSENAKVTTVKQTRSVAWELSRSRRKTGHSQPDATAAISAPFPRPQNQKHARDETQL